MGMFGKKREPLKTTEVASPRAKAPARHGAPPRSNAPPRDDEDAALMEKHDPDGVVKRHAAEAKRKREGVSAGTTVQYAITDRYSVPAFVLCTHADGTVDLKYKDVRESPQEWVKMDVPGSDGSVTGTWFVG